MRALITNDDGIGSPGLHQLALEAVAAGLEVVVAAPVREASGASASMTAQWQQGRVPVFDRDLKLDGVRAYAVEASPGLITLIATRGGFGDPPDLVLSGINRGANAGYAVMHSGTVGAAFTAMVNGCRAMAVSLDLFTGDDPLDLADPAYLSDDRRHWRTAARLMSTLLPVLVRLPEPTVLNLNVPDLPLDRLRGLRQATLGRFGQVQMTVVEKGSGFVRTSLEERDERHHPGTDMALLADGFATVTALQSLREAPIDLPDLDHLVVGGGVD